MNTPAEAVVAVVGDNMGVVAIVYDVACFCTSEGICGVASATDGGGSIQKHVLLFAKRTIKPVQGRTGLIVPLQKPQMLFDRPRTEIFKNVLPCTFLNYEFFSGKTCFCLTPLTSCQYEFDIPSNSLSSAVQGCTMLDRGYRFNRCP